jgi:hypothetical protein
MGTVRAKFKCTAVTTNESGKTISLRPVYGNGDPNHENTQFYKYTPGGSIELSTVNEEAANKFEVGKEFYVDFTLAE